MANNIPNVSENPQLIIRADASSQLGIGHVMRCLALAQAWRESGGKVCFALAMESPELEARLAIEGIDVIDLASEPGSLDDARQTIDLAQTLHAGWVVIDGYHFNAAYQKAFRETDLSTLVIDDYGHAEHYYADVVLNQNIYADEPLYVRREPYTNLLLGTKYALLRREFRDWGNWQPAVPPMARKILVTLGGSDPDNVTQRVIRSLQMVNSSDLEIKIVVGPANKHLESLSHALMYLDHEVELLTATRNMPQLMSWADIAISAAGSTCWELSFMGVPTMVVVLADNQKPIAEGLHQANAALNCGWHTQIEEEALAETVEKLLLDTDLRRKLSYQARALVDGRGATRVTEALYLARQRVKDI